MNRFLVATALTAASLSACQPRYDEPTVSLRLRGGPPDAIVTVDDERVAPLAVVQKRGVALRPGRHRITVEREGYFPWDKAVEASDEPVHLDVQLVKIPQ